MSSNEQGEIMKEPDIHNSIFQALREYELMEELQPSSEWQDSLMEKLAGSKRLTQSRPHVLVAVAIVILLIMNIGSLLTIRSTHSGQTLHRDAALQSISSEFLFQPISLSN
jgi:hypothetical protein